MYCVYVCGPTHDYNSVLLSTDDEQLRTRCTWSSCQWCCGCGATLWFTFVGSGVVGWTQSRSTFSSPIQCINSVFSTIYQTFQIRFIICVRREPICVVHSSDYRGIFIYQILQVWMPLREVNG